MLCTKVFQQLTIPMMPLLLFHGTSLLNGPVVILQLKLNTGYVCSNNSNTAEEQTGCIRAVVEKI